VILRLLSRPDSAQFITAFFRSLLQAAITGQPNMRDNLASAEPIRSASIVCGALALLFRMPDAGLECFWTIGLEFGALDWFLQTFVFTPDAALWSADPAAEDSNFYAVLRQGVLCLFGRCLHCHPELAMASIQKCLEMPAPRLIGELLAFLVDFLSAEDFEPARLLDKPDFLRVLIHLHYRFQEAQENRLSTQVSQTRASLYELFLLLARSPLARRCLFSEASFVTLLYSMIFERGLERFGQKLIADGLKFYEPGFRYLLVQTDVLLSAALCHPGDQEWLSLLHSFIAKWPKYLRGNKSLAEAAVQGDFETAISAIPALTDSLDLKIELVAVVLRCFIHIAPISETVSAKIAGFPMSIIVSQLAGRQFDHGIVNLFLGLVFECDMDIRQLPEVAAIANFYMIPPLHEITKHLPVHHELFAFLARICEQSLANRYAVFRSKFPIKIIEFMQSFPSESACTADETASQGVLLKLFSEVSASFFDWATFAAVLSALKPVNDSRMWWSSPILAAVCAVVRRARSLQRPSSFFHFSGRLGGLDLPINAEPPRLETRFTLLAHFALESATILPESSFCSLSFEGGILIALTFDPQRHVSLTCCSDGCALRKQSTFVFKVGVWYRLSMMADASSIAVFVNREKIETMTLSKPLPVRPMVAGTVANSPLICSLSSLHLFSGALSPAQVEQIASLPIDFSGAFCPASLHLLPQIEPNLRPLFSDAFGAKQRLCYSAQTIRDGNIAVNLAPNRAGDAPVTAILVRFSQTIFDVVAQVGGLANFLPLFLQVNSQCPDSSSSLFLELLVSLLAKFCKCSPTLFDDFFARDGTKALAHLLISVSREILSEKVINKLFGMSARLKSEAHRRTMLGGLLFNFPLWTSHFLVRRTNPGNTGHRRIRLSPRCQV
jgi:hypothetical protein